ncbi:MAG: cupin domain-containing protein [Alphaproteobacteria bacterium]|jgi:gentisate 1,2-dioxygenase
MAGKKKDSAASRDSFDQGVRDKNLVGYWMIPSRTVGYREPTPSYQPFLWGWDDIYKTLFEAVDHIPPEEAHRRFIGFQNPDLELGTSPNLVLGAQMILAGEMAPCHRHTMDAVRFVVEGNGEGCTVVDGEEFFMTRGDLITTPNWSWHDHINNGSVPTIWLDGAVAPLIVHFQIGFGEPHQSPHQDLTRDVGWSSKRFGTLRPITLSGKQDPSSAPRAAYCYPWAETEAALYGLAEGGGELDAFDGAFLHYVNPETDGPTLPTVGCDIQMLAARKKYRAHRHTHAAIYHVYEGEGTTVIGDQRFDWKKGDSFVVPLWTWHAHENGSDEPAILFSINDEPVMRSLGFHREEVREEAAPA